MNLSSVRELSSFEQGILVSHAVHVLAFLSTLSLLSKPTRLKHQFNAEPRARLPIPPDPQS